MVAEHLATSVSHWSRAVPGTRRSERWAQNLVGAGLRVSQGYSSEQGLHGPRICKRAREQASNHSERRTTAERRVVLYNNTSTCMGRKRQWGPQMKTQLLVWGAGKGGNSKGFRESLTGNKRVRWGSVSQDRTDLTVPGHWIRPSTKQLHTHVDQVCNTPTRHTCGCCPDRGEGRCLRRSWYGCTARRGGCWRLVGHSGSQLRCAGDVEYTPISKT